MAASQLYIESRKMPFVRLLIALTTGILSQWYFNCSAVVFICLLAAGAIGFLSFFYVPAYTMFKLQWLRGVCILIMITSCGGLLSYLKNPLHQKDNYTHVYQPGDAIVAKVNEALIGKPKTYKANVSVTAVYRNKRYVPATGTFIVYFDKKNIDSQLRYGSQILFTKPLQKIKNSGNPGAFDYSRFLLFQGVTAQVYLQNDEYNTLPVNTGSSFQKFLHQTRAYVIRTIQTYIPGKDEQSVAEALLIGYRNDLDKQLVSSYSNTGVVHIIAISGLHLGMIYGFILLLFSPCKNRAWYRFAVPVIAMAVLWLFTLLAGAVPSILRSAVMFSFMAGGMFINRKTNIYNTLAASAFCLLIYNPYLLWDVGFQLSYTAVLGIVLFTKPLSGCLYFQNKFLSKLWLATSVTLAAQILTLPVILYNFHQFPVFFLFTNLLIVPLSEIILFVTLFLVVTGASTWLSVFVGKIANALLWLMNSIIVHTAQLPFSVLANIKTDVVQAWLLYALIVLLAAWLLYKMSRLLLYGVSFLIVFFIYTATDIWQKTHQQKLVVYNIPKHSAIDILSHEKAICFYDKTLPADITANSFSINPAHTLFRINEYGNYALPRDINLFYQAGEKKIIIISHQLPALQIKQKCKADIVVITGNPKIYIDDLCKSIDCRIIIADNNIPQWKLHKWKQDCDQRHIRFHSILQQGGFVADL